MEDPLEVAEASKGPHIRANKHIVKEGSRQHVTHYVLFKGHGYAICSDTWCENNLNLPDEINPQTQKATP